jgi:hypothetical protein
VLVSKTGVIPLVVALSKTTGVPKESVVPDKDATTPVP